MLSIRDLPENNIYIYIHTHTHTYRLKVKKWKKTFHANWSKKKNLGKELICDKIGFKTKAVERDKGHHIMTS